jgi:integrase
LRHFTATRLIAAGVPVRTVSGRLGHASPSTTLTVYSHFVEASDQDAANVMGELLPKSRGKARK